MADLVKRLRERLPSTWELSLDPPPGRSRPDACLKITANNGKTATIAIETIGARTAPYARYVLEILRRVREEMPDLPLLALAPYFTPSIRAQLTQQGIAYADATGNLRLALDEPAVFVETTGADRDPRPDDQPLRSLRGAAAGRAVRAFCDFAPPYGTRELSKLTGVPAPTLSRVAALLESEGILTRERDRGPIVAVDWKLSLLRWSEDYSFTRSNRTSSWLEPRGLPALQAKLRDASSRYMLTGSLAANAIAPVASPRLAALYVESAQNTAGQLGLRPAESGGNVLLAEPFDAVAFERGFDREGLRYAAHSQIAIDLMTGPGRWPAEGEAVMQWMQTNESAWRT